MLKENAKPVSVHGGHSGQFCNHATDSLEDVILQYIALGFPWVGITEHAPSYSQELLYPDQKEAGLTPKFLYQRFAKYVQECRRLKEKYKDQIEIIVAMEIETYSNFETFVPQLLQEFSLEYIVGSLHFVDDMGIDYSQEQYNETAAKLGGIDALYCRYFDNQYEMLETLKPAVVGHFDLARIFDPQYKERILKKEILSRITRNLECIKKHDLIMDYNLRSLYKGAEEPYISKTILDIATKMEIKIAPGDDSHGVSSVGNFMATAYENLAQYGYTEPWPKPKLYSY